MSDPAPAPSPSTTDDGDGGFTGASQNSMIIILAAFAIVGILAGFAIVLPDNAVRVETIVTAVIAGLLGFIAGRKR